MEKHELTIKETQALSFEILHTGNRCQAHLHTLVRFLVFYILANWFPYHRTARTSKPEYSACEKKV